MNWVDFVVLGVVIIGVFVGWRIGFLGAIFTTAGVIIGMLLAGQLSDDIAAAFTNTVSNDAVATALAYAILVGGSIAAAMAARSITKKMLSLIFLGWVDSLGSLTLGLVAGVLLGGAVITFAARFSQDVPGAGIEGTFIEMMGIRGDINNALIGSSLVPVWLDVVDALPASARRLIPGDLGLVLERLDQRVETKGWAK